MPIGLAPQLPGSESYTAPWGRDPIPDAPPPPLPDAPDDGQPVAAPAAPPPVPYGTKYEPAVERWRPGLMAEFKAQGVPTVDSRGNDLIDKALHVLTYESHGDDTAVGDNGAAWGGFQDHHIPAGTPMAGQIASAVSLIKKNPDQWTDWGEGVTYQGQPFGALGRVPYGSAAPTGAGIFGASSNGFTNLSSSRARIPTHYEPSSDEPLSGQAGRPVGGFRDTELQPDPNATTSDPFTAVGRGIKTGYDAAANAASSIGPAALMGDATDTPEDPLTSAIALQRKAEDLTRDRRLQYLHEQAMKAGGGQLGPDGKVRPGGIGSTIAGVAVPDNVADVALMAEPFKDAIASRGKALIKTGAEFAAPEAAPFGSAEYRAGLGGAPGFDAQKQLDQMAAEDAAKAEANKAAPNSIHFNPETNAFERTAPETTPPAGTTALSPPQRGADGLPEPAGAPPANEAPAGTSYDPATQDPKTLDELRAKLRYDYQNHTPPPAISEDELKQQLREGIAPGEETPQSTLDRYREDPSSVEKGDLVSAQQKIAVSQGTKADLADQLEQSIQALHEASRAGTITPEEAQASETTIRKLQKSARATAPTSGPARGLDGTAQGVAAQPLPPEQPDLFNQSVQKSFAEAKPVTEGTPNQPPTPDEKAANFAQRTLSKFNPVTGNPRLQTAWRNTVDLINAPTRFLTYGHLPVLRQGLGFSLSHPSTFREAFQNLATVARNPEAYDAINEGLNASTFTKAAKDAGWFKEGEAPTETAVAHAINKFPGMLNSSESARAYLTTLRKAGFESEAARLFHSGDNIPEQAFKDLWDTISDVTGHGARGSSFNIGGVNPAFSWQAMLGRFHSITDPFTMSGSLNPLSPGARSVAIRNLIALGAVTEGINGIAKAAGADVNWDINTPLGKAKIGESTLDPSAGMSSIVKLGAKLATASVSATHGDYNPILDTVLGFFRGQLGAAPDAAISTLLGKDWQGKHFNLFERASENPLDIHNDSLLRNSLAPIAAQNIIDAVQANGPVGALIAAPSLAAGGVETNLLTAARDDAARRIGAKDYASAGPAVKFQVSQDPAVIKAQGRQTEYQSTKMHEEAKDPAIQEARRAEQSFEQGVPIDEPLREKWHDEGVSRQRGAVDLETQFQSMFSNFNKNTYEKALEGYYAIQEKDSDGNTGSSDALDATEAARQDYLNKLAPGPKQWIDEALQVSRQKVALTSPEHAAYLDYIDQKKAAGYFSKGADARALDAANPDIDVSGWKFGSDVRPDQNGKDITPALNSTAAVDKALAMNLPNRPVKLAGLPRPVNQDAKSLEAWNYSKKPLTWYDGQLIDDNWQAEAKRLATTTKDAGYAKPLDQMDSAHRGIIIGNIHQKARQDIPELDAMLYWFGVGEKPTTQAGANLLPGIMQKFGNRPPVPAKP